MQFTSEQVSIIKRLAKYVNEYANEAYLIHESAVLLNYIDDLSGVSREVSKYDHTTA